MRSHPVLAALVPVLLAACAVGCGSKSDDTQTSGPPPRSLVGHPKNGELPPDLICPGDPACPASGDGTLKVGAAVEKITAPITEKLTYSAKGKPWEYRAAGGDKFDDANGNGVFDATWMAGFGTGRAAAGVNDDTYVRAVVLEQGSTKIAMVSVDCVGWMYEEVVRTRAELAAAGVDVSYLMMAATHVHEARDTMGIWGVDDATSGLDKTYNAFIRAQAIKAIKAALASAERVNVTFGSIKVDGHLKEADPKGRGVKSLISDTRDPVILDLAMNTMRFTRAGGDKGTVATLVNFAAHPEFADDKNTLLSSDFAWTLREGIEKGVDVGPMKKAGVGGIAVYLQGACGGQIGPGRVEVADATGKDFPEPTDAEPNSGLLRAKAIGQNYAYYALTSLDAGQGAATWETVRIGARIRKVYGGIENRAYHVALASRLFDRTAYHYDPALPINGDNQPDLLTEVGVLDIGPAQLLMIPGEIHPELVVGMAPELTPAPYLRVQTDNKNPPKLDKAPATGHLRSFGDPAAKFHWTLGLMNDEIGYILPSWNYELDPADPYYEEAQGDHYEETNSIGPLVEAEIVEPLRDLLKNTKTPISRP